MCIIANQVKGNDREERQDLKQNLLLSRARKKESWLDGPKALVISTAIMTVIELIKHFTK